MLAPPVRLVNRQVMKKWGDVPYYGTVIGTRVDKDGELLYCVRYQDNDYEEYSFLDIMRYLQPYDPFHGEDDLVEITPFFNKHKTLFQSPKAPTGKTPAAPARKAPAAQAPDSSAPTGNRRSSRVRVIRHIHNVRGPESDTHVPSSISSIRSRKAYRAKIKAFNALTRKRARYVNTMRKIIKARAARAFTKRNRHKTPKPPATPTMVPEIHLPKGTKVDTLPIPASYHEAVTGPYRRYWIKAIAEEMANLREYKVWRIQKKPKHARPIKGMFVFKWKPNEDGTLNKAKARFTMKGCAQKKGVHYHKTYASVAALMTVYLTCIIGTELDYSMHQVDLKAAYLSAPLEPDIEMFLDPPPGVHVPDGMGLRVMQALYGSMQGAERLDAYK